MNPFTQDELDRISKVKEANDKLEDFFKTKRSEWNSNIEPLFEVLKTDMTNPSSSKKILDAQSFALIYRQQINDQISFFLNKRSKETAKIKNLKQEKLIFYAIGFSIKSNGTEKNTLIDGHIAENDRCTELIETYIDFLRDTVKCLESLGYSIKNMIELLNYLGR